MASARLILRSIGAKGGYKDHRQITPPFVGFDGAAYLNAVLSAQINIHEALRVRLVVAGEQSLSARILRS